MKKPMYKYLFTFLILFSSISFSQINKLEKIINIDFGSSIKIIKNQWAEFNFNPNQLFIKEIDDAIKFENKDDSSYLICNYYLIQDSLFSLSVFTKSNDKESRLLLGSLTNNLGNPDTSSWKNDLIYKWEQKNDNDNSVNKYYFSYRINKDGQLYIQFSKNNSRLSEKAIKTNKHVGHI